VTRTIDRCPTCHSGCKGRITGTADDDTMCPDRWHDRPPEGEYRTIRSIEVSIMLRAMTFPEKARNWFTCVAYAEAAVNSEDVRTGGFRLYAVDGEDVTRGLFVQARARIYARSRSRVWTDYRRDAATPHAAP
jgi:hypothetical protein